MNTDVELINATLSGVKSAFGILAARHQTQVYRLAYRIIGNPSDASDTVQETLLKAYQNLELLRDKNKFSFWLLQIAKNQCISWIREHQKALMTVEDELTNNRLYQPPAPDEILVKRELHERVMVEISKLPEHSRKAVEMFYIEGKSYTEIQGELGITKGTLGRRLHDAKAQLRKRLREAYLGAAFWVGDSLKRLNPWHTKAITGGSAISGLKYLMVSLALHGLIFTGISAMGVHWGTPNGINDISSYGSVVDISLVKINNPDRISLPSHITIKSSSSSHARENYLKSPRRVKFMPVERIMLKLPWLRLKRPGSRIIQAEAISEIPPQRFEVVLADPIIHTSFPLDRAIPRTDFAFPGVTGSLGRAFPTPDGMLSLRSRNELALPNEAASSIAKPFYDSKAQPRIIFISNREDKHRSHIYIMNIDGTGVKRLDNDDLHQWSASVSPEGRQITFHTSSNSRVSYPGIYSMGVDNGHLEFLTLGVSPAWSPDGKKIAFCRPEAGNSEIYIMDKGGFEAPLTRNRASSLRPAWSPDSARIAFSSNITDRRIRNIYVMNADGTDTKQLTHTSTVGWWNDYPAWSPDGTRIAYAAGKTGRKYSILTMLDFMGHDFFG